MDISDIEKKVREAYDTYMSKDEIMGGKGTSEIEEKPVATKRDRIIPKTAPGKSFNGSPVMTAEVRTSIKSAEMHQGTMKEAKEKAAQTAEPRTAIKDSSMKGDLSMIGEALILEINDSSGGGRDGR